MGPGLRRDDRIIHPASAAFTNPLALPKSIWPAYFALKHRDHLAHVLHAGGAGLGDRGRYRGLDVVLRHLLRQIGRDDRDLLALLGGEFGAAALVVEFDGFLALLDHLLEHAEQVGIGKRRLALPARGDVGVLDGRIDHPQRGELALVLGPHRVLDRIVDVVAQHRSHPFDIQSPDLGRSRRWNNLAAQPFGQRIRRRLRLFHLRQVTAIGSTTNFAPGMPLDHLHRERVRDGVVLVAGQNQRRALIHASVGRESGRPITAICWRMKASGPISSPMS